MKLAALALASTNLALAGCASYPVTEELRAEAQGEVADVAFEALGKRYIDGMIALNPVAATQLGDHSRDSDLPDVSATGRAAQKRMSQAMLEALKTIDKSALSRENQVDYMLLKNALEYELWSMDTEQQWAWNPQYYNDLASYSLYGLVARDYAPFPDRFDHIVDRMEKLPAMLASARRQIDVARVPKIHAETVSKQNAGILAIVEGLIEPQIEANGLDRTRYDAAKEGLVKAIGEHQEWLDEVVVPGAKGDFRLGSEKYAAKMAYALQSSMSVSQLKARAEQAYTETRAHMLSVASKIGDCGSIEARNAAARQQAVIECGLEKSYENRAPRDGLEEAARATLAQAIAFTNEKGFIDPMDGEVEIITMPEFWQGNAVAYLDAPPPLQRDLAAYYAVSPIPDDWSEEQATSFLKEYNISMLHLLSIHEGVPGHALQLDHSNKYDNLLRSVLGSGPFVEGWAVYSEKVMADEGYLGGIETEQGRYFLLNGLKFRLRAIINTLLDIGIHTEGMDREAAMTLMMEGGFQQEREAAGKWTRANLGSTQLLSYFTGYSEHVALREEAEKRFGSQFDQRAYHNEILAHGSPPVKYARALLFDLPIE
ncbi:lipoprotein, putative [Altererythrobacter epoxidivorans]|uniref:Lipoprotein, putative n=1 Tax=Altererythrobacter epoxidivorans TaxID=361183 RepID=A0A0M4M5K1_9SPHN|nr:DUF885 domain-containing protein [Altererythrobacter epoxidivorans]ALE17340.1 lipoprotein, putative [Altererythrobacter epoxidivorans]